MITAYLAGISDGYEGEDIEVRYSIYEGDQLILKKSLVREYKKPAIVNLFSLITLLKELEAYKGQDIIVMVNDAAMGEQLKGTTKTKNRDVLKTARIAREKLDEFNNKVTIKDISQDKEKLAQWDAITSP